MKVVREHINEKFTDKSDPIKDMGIGKINFREEFEKQYQIPANKLYRKWEQFMYQFKGKWISGLFHRYGALNKDKYHAEPVHAKVKYDNVTLTDEGIINLEFKNEGVTYCIIKGESYEISDK